MSWWKSFFGDQQSISINTSDASPLDVVAYVSSFASNQELVDPLLEPMRDITTHLTSDHSLTDADQVSLVGVYKKIVFHLTNDEPTLIITKESIEKRVRETFSLRSKRNKKFWDELARL